MEITELALRLIDEDPGQPRYQFEDEALQELMRSIEELGLLSPIKVRPVPGGRYQIIYGNRRYKACSMLGLDHIPCIVSTVTDETEIYLEQIAENLTREGFSPIEEAEAFDKLLKDAKFGSSVKFLASRLGKPESYIRNKCELLKFGAAVRKRIVRGTEIRPDCLTEDQLLPLKALPLEYRDSLALIAARDELAPTDVKKIASLYKDATISDSTKNKLLARSGPELIDTWSVYRQNRAERAKQAAQAQAEAQQTETQETETQEAPSLPASSDASAATAQAQAHPGESDAAGTTSPPQQPAHRAQTQTAPLPFKAEMELLLDAMERQTNAGAANVSLAPDPSALRADIDAVIDGLQAQLLRWQAIRKALKS
ncbi:ParB/RepB/Spo0J family partition protein [Paenibacillus sp. IB182496]|uniref:ParB/RepB/Spo0J family partition protein n=1 Tax=Paenibacillus sabuli TaxID=2772509 RepID=A0A927BVQ4_9BACL|nr:ParB/RepB/Spo0J family partition protein [Paenibacillus sabuli]MBD2847721.1 ParB/RepB/Spo0J family partition protein [Paenibacillus sabuli]